MICQRCGNCCYSMFVVIQAEGKLRLKPADILCPHISFDGPIASCAVHEEPWFKNSPCHIYGNSDIDPDFFHRKRKPCLVGAMLQKGGGLEKVKGPLQKAALEELEMPEDIDPDMVGDFGETTTG